MLKVINFRILYNIIPTGLRVSAALLNLSLKMQDSVRLDKNEYFKQNKQTY